jgi:hypothetical protein
MLRSSVPIGQRGSATHSATTQPCFKRRTSQGVRTQTRTGAFPRAPMAPKGRGCVWPCPPCCPELGGCANSVVFRPGPRIRRSWHRGSPRTRLIPGEGRVSVRTVCLFKLGEQTPWVLPPLNLNAASTRTRYTTLGSHETDVGPLVVWNEQVLRPRQQPPASERAPCGVRWIRRKRHRPGES